MTGTNDRAKLNMAEKYAQELWRITRCSDGWIFQDDCRHQIIRLVGEAWTCSCEAFQSQPIYGANCVHIRAMDMSDAWSKTEPPFPNAMPTIAEWCRIWRLAWTAGLGQGASRNWNARRRFDW